MRKKFRYTILRKDKKSYKSLFTKFKYNKWMPIKKELLFTNISDMYTALCYMCNDPYIKCCKIQVKHHIEDVYGVAQHKVQRWKYGKLVQF